MHKILIIDSTQACQAIFWCLEHLDRNDWDVQTKWPISGVEFKFENLRDASWFGLTWAQ